MIPTSIKSILKCIQLPFLSFLLLEVLTCIVKASSYSIRIFIKAILSEFCHYFLQKHHLFFPVYDPDDDD